MLQICSYYETKQGGSHDVACDLSVWRVQVRFSFDEPDFAMIDTLFSLAEAHLFMQLVSYLPSCPSGHLLDCLAVYSSRGAPLHAAGNLFIILSVRPSA